MNNDELIYGWIANNFGWVSVRRNSPDEDWEYVGVTGTEEDAVTLSTFDEENGFETDIQELDATEAERILDQSEYAITLVGEEEPYALVATLQAAQNLQLIDHYAGFEAIIEPL